MAEPQVEEKQNAVLPQMPTSITATQVIALLLILASKTWVRDAEHAEA